jgi:geranylgeranyl pyrophosphate synthase
LARESRPRNGRRENFIEISDRYRDMKGRSAVQTRASPTFRCGLGDGLGRERAVMTAIIHATIKGAPLAMPPVVVDRPQVDSEADCYADRLARSERVLSWIEDLIEQTTASNEQRALLQTAAVDLQRGISSVAVSGDCIPSIELPLAVHTAITGAQDGPIPLAAACALVCIGAKLFDDVADGDRPSHWRRYSAGEMSLAAATILTALPPIILARLDIEPERRLRMQQILAEGLLRISAGQQADLALTGRRAATVAEVEASVVGKTGERFATYCRLAAEMAGASPEVGTLYGVVGCEIGIARQLISDCHELVIDPECRDLQHGARTRPIVAHMNRLTGAERARFLDLLDLALTDRGAEIAVRQELHASGEIGRTLLWARLRYGRARAIVDRIGALEPGRTRLLRVISPDSGASP